MKSPKSIDGVRMSKRFVAFYPCLEVMLETSPEGSWYFLEKLKYRDYEEEKAVKKWMAVARRCQFMRGKSWVLLCVKGARG